MVGLVRRCYGGEFYFGVDGVYGVLLGLEVGWWWGVVVVYWFF